MNLSLLVQLRLVLGFTFRILFHSTYAIGAAPSGRPGCPELAFSIDSAERTLSVLTAKLSFKSNPI